MKLYIVRDLNNPSILKQERRSSPQGVICICPEELEGKAFRLVDRIHPETKVPYKEAELDADAENQRVAAEVAKIQEEDQFRLNKQQAINLYKSLDPEGINNLAECRQYLKAIKDLLKFLYLELKD